MGPITARTCFFLSSFEDWRTRIVSANTDLLVFCDLGHGVMDDAMVDAAAYVLEKR